MSEPIKVGDLVMLVRICCVDKEQWLGHITTVEGTYPNGAKRCPACGYTPEGMVLIVNLPRNNGGPPSWFKRIPPLEELEREKLVEKLRELI